ncbi:high mobility group protein HMGI-C-like isoform X2 [Erythrolamprus reginae]|uniref:high mobility group protein HMGI-C-like isoform X2 n=1 Tax=Erythrolamprus reginae TaxID=121349 RepID=UPI00396CECC2
MSHLGKPTAPATTILTEQPKRKRGRPRKQPQDPAGPLPPKKPRGRPKGSKKRSASCGQMLFVAEEEYHKTEVQGESNPDFNTCPATEGTSTKGCRMKKGATEFKRTLNEQQSSC